MATVQNIKMYEVYSDYNRFTETLIEALNQTSGKNISERITSILEILNFIRNNFIHFTNPLFAPYISVCMKQIYQLQDEVLVLVKDPSLISRFNHLFKDISNKLSFSIKQPSIPFTSSVFTPPTDIHYVIDSLIPPPKVLSISSFGEKITKYLKNFSSEIYLDFLYFVSTNIEYLTYPSLNYIARQIYIKVLWLHEEGVESENIKDILTFYEAHPELMHQAPFEMEYTEDDYKEDNASKDVLKKKIEVIEKVAEISVQKIRITTKLTILGQEMNLKVEWWLRKKELIEPEMYVDCECKAEHAITIEFGVYNRVGDKIYKNRNTFLLQGDFAAPVKGAPDDLISFLRKDIDTFLQLNEEYKKLI